MTSRQWRTIRLLVGGSLLMVLSYTLPEPTALVFVVVGFAAILAA